MGDLKYDEIIEQGILYNFIAFDVPRLATYLHEKNQYDIKNGGWQKINKTVLVIGETEDSFITELKPTEHGEWNCKRILYKYTLPLGFHRSRFVKWENTQLSLLEN